MIGFILFFFFLMFTYSRERDWDRVRVGEGQRERGRHRIWSRLQALSCQHRARRGARTHRLWDHDPSRSGTLNRLSHPGAPQAESYCFPTTPLSTGSSRSKTSVTVRQEIHFEQLFCAWPWSMCGRRPGSDTHPAFRHLPSESEKIKQVTVVFPSLFIW